MKVMTWNVNGIKTLLQYRPWNSLRTYEDICLELGADIICFQETKITKKQIERSMAILPSFDSFFSSYSRKPEKGYSGTCIFTKRSTCVPIRAEEGISGLLSQDRRPEPKPAELIGGNLKPGDIALNMQDVKIIDLEGRTTMVDFGLFVLINCYFPNETNEDRLDFKLAFNAIFEARVLNLIRQGRQVIAVGDINIAAQPIDHCDPNRRASESTYGGYEMHPARKWFNEFISQQGSMIDVARHFHPGRKSMFTHWETRINARETNYGSRIDYILATPGIMPWIKNCDIQPHILGSDHCPVVAEFHDSLVHQDGRTVLLWKQINPPGRVNECDAPTPDPPKLAARYFSDFGSEQRSLKNFFGKSATQAKDKSCSVAQREQSELSMSEHAKGAVSVSPMSTAASPPVPEATGPASPAAVAAPPAGAGAGAANHLDLTGDAIDDEQPNKAMKSSSQTATSVLSLKQPGSDSAVPNKFHKRKTRKGQQNLSSFFKPSSPVPSISGVKADEKPSKKRKQTEQDAVHSPAAMDQHDLFSLKKQNTSHTLDATSNTPELIDIDEIASVASDEDADANLVALRDKAMNRTRVRNIAVECTKSLPNDEQDEVEMRDAMASASSNEQASTAWSSIFSARIPPLCTMHGEPCKQWTVNKSGPNKNRVFWLCSRPVGEGYDQGQSKSLVNPEYRCNFFKWESDVKRSVSRNPKRHRRTQSYRDSE